MFYGPQRVAAKHVVHFDLKCDNVLLERAPGCPDWAAFWRPPGEAPPFRAVLADFGESRMYACAEDAYTVR